MKVFNLSCSNDHAFEGWFRSADDFVSQQSHGQIACPMCGDIAVRKLLSAPRLNLGAHAEPTQNVGQANQGLRSADVAQPSNEGAIGTNIAPAPAVNHPSIEQMQALWYRMAAQVLRNTEDVGENFAEEARKMHYQEAPERAIRGNASAQEAAELKEEGIDLFAIAIPAALKEPLQ
jgi:hypothetical protein